MLAIRFNYLTADEPCEAAFKRVLQLSRNYMICTLIYTGPGSFGDPMTHIRSVSFPRYLINDDGMTKDMLVKLNETLLKCVLNS